MAFHRARWGLTSPPPHEAGAAPSLGSDTSGAVYVEYIVITIVIGIVVSAALVGLGVPIYRSFRLTQLFLGAPIP